MVLYDLDHELELIADKHLIDGDELSTLRSLALDFQCSPQEILDGTAGHSPISCVNSHKLSEAATLSRRDTQVGGLQSVSLEELQWGRYHHLRLLGRGGMGSVYSAQDSQLNRAVALKFLHHLGPKGITRFFGEARAQARVNHPHVAAVYEVDEFRGKPFIAMQLIQGQPLDVACANMSLEETLMIFKGAVEGVGAAHQVGLIHRDIKPGNIMVERNGQGRCHAYVLDFGLAHVATEGFTLEGTVMGTPAYMAPEQARGEVHGLDRRADIYGLGATLFQLLTGRAPFLEDNTPAMLVAIMEQDPPPPRSINSQIPEEVETIILKCLEKDPGRRYGSTQALAEDLRRYLAGEPLLARPPSLGYYLGKHIRRKKPLYVAMAMVVLILMGALLWNVASARRAADREILVRRLTEEVTEVKQLARRIYLHPIHDITLELKELKHRVENLGTVYGGNENDAGPILHAQGEAMLSLGDPQRAVAFLEQAQNLGYDAPDLTYSLGYSHALLYRNEMNRIQMLGDSSPKIQEDLAALQDKVATYSRRVAQDHSGLPKAYLDALPAMCEGRWEESLALLQECVGIPGFYEAYQLQGDIFRARAARPTEEENDEKRLFLQDALDAYKQARDIARSNSEIYLLSAQTHADMLALPKLDDPESVFEKGMKLLDQAEMILPDEGRIPLIRARLIRLYADTARGDGKLQLEQLSLARDEALSAVCSGESSGWMELGSTLWRMARASERETGPLAMAALNAMANVPQRDRGHKYFNALALCYGYYAKANRHTHEIYLEYQYKKLSALDEARRRAPNEFKYYYTTAQAYHDLAKLPFGDIDPMDHLDDALTAINEALAIEKNDWRSWLLLARIYNTMAQGGRPQLARLNPALAEAGLNMFAQAQRSNAKEPTILDSKGYAHMELGKWYRDRGEGFESQLGQAISAFEEAYHLADIDMRLRNLGQAHYWLGKFQLRCCENPYPELNEAAQLLSDSNSKGSRLFMANVLRMKAEAELIAGGDPMEYILEGENILADLSEPYTDLEVFRTSACMASLKAFHYLRVGVDPQETLQLGWQYLEQAFKQDPEAPSIKLAAARHSLVNAYAGGDDSVTCMIEKGLYYCKESPVGDHLLIEAYLLALKAEITSDEALGRQAEYLKNQALESNPNLCVQWYMNERVLF